MTALIIGASGAIGQALQETLTQRFGANGVQSLSRHVDGFDLTDETAIAKAADRMSGPFEMICLATGVLAPRGQSPEKSLAHIDPSAMAETFALNTIGPALVLKHFQRHLPKRGRSVFAVLSARVGSIGDNRLGGWHSYRASKAALNQIMRGAAIELSRTRPDAICVALHPGTVESRLSADYVNRHPAQTPRDAAQNLLRVIDGLGAQDTGQFLDWRGDRIAW